MCISSANDFYTSDGRPRSRRLALEETELWRAGKIVDMLPKTKAWGGGGMYSRTVTCLSR